MPNPFGNCFVYIYIVVLHLFQWRNCGIFHAAYSVPWDVSSGATNYLTKSTIVNELLNAKVSIIESCLKM